MAVKASHPPAAALFFEGSLLFAAESSTPPHATLLRSIAKDEGFALVHPGSDAGGEVECECECECEARDGEPRASRSVHRLSRRSVRAILSSASSIAVIRLEVAERVGCPQARGVERRRQ
jgi:hypothetical protein